MFAFWYWTFGCLALFLVFLVWWAVVYKKAVDERKKARDYRTRYKDSGFSNEEYYAKFQEHEKTGYKYEGRECAPFVLGIVFGLALWIFLLISIFAPISARHELIKFEETKAVYEQSISEGSDYENVAMTSKVVEANSWLAGARSSVRFFGKYSKYSAIGLDSIEPITLVKDGE